MIVAIHQPNYFPYYGYFHKIKSSDLFVFLDNVTYSKENFTNRNRVKTPQGEKWLTVPIFKKGILEMEIKDVSIMNTDDWRRSHFGIIRDSYRKSRYFHPYENIISSIYRKEWDNLCDLNIFITEKLSSVLGISAKFVRASELDVHGKKADLIFDICKTLGADTYYCGVSGKKYNDEQKFKDSNIKVIYQEFVHPIYEQPYGDFIPNLSILDLFFNMRIGEYL